MKGGGVITITVGETIDKPTKEILDKLIMKNNEKYQIATKFINYDHVIPYSERAKFHRTHFYKRTWNEIYARQQKSIEHLSSDLQDEIKKNIQLIKDIGEGTKPKIYKKGYWKEIDFKNFKRIYSLDKYQVIILSTDEKKFTIDTILSEIKSITINYNDNFVITSVSE